MNSKPITQVCRMENGSLPIILIEREMKMEARIFKKVEIIKAAKPDDLKSAVVKSETK